MTRRLRGFFFHAPATCALALACAIVYAAQRVLAGVEFQVGHPFLEPFMYTFGLHAPLLFTEGFFWQPLTYAFLHGPLWHLLFNLLGLVLFGRALEAELRTPRFLLLFFASSTLGGLFWALGDGLWWMFTAEPFGMCIGASGGVYGLIGAYTALYANRKLYVLLFFIPLRLRGKWLALVLLLLTIADAAFGITGTAYMAHFVGFVVGWLYGWRLRRLGYGEGYAV